MASTNHASVILAEEARETTQAFQALAVTHSTNASSVSSMRFLITGQAIDGYSEQDDEIRFSDSCFQFCVESLMRKSNSGYNIDELTILWILNSCLYRQKYEDKVVSRMDHKGAKFWYCADEQTSRCIRNSGIVPMSRQVDASGLENQHGELPENELFPKFKTLKSSQTSKRGLGCFC
ncbi:hypothetical protein F2Q69_00029741 [Brassica cretica]|uniref:Uncharacterized protein n=1 Tax=Brassica cretica TaxID=69181 RepID=A0A8S9S5Q4_BRACR|nr:hypothetical protein F2Q69_00029741 [Brassica cretica]